MQEALSGEVPSGIHRHTRQRELRRYFRRLQGDRDGLGFRRGTRPSQSDQPLHEPDPALLQGASEDPQEEHPEVAERGLLYVREPPGDFRRALGLGFRKNIFFRENPQKEGHLDGLINTIVPPSHKFIPFIII